MAKKKIMKELKKPKRGEKNWWIALSLVGIFFLVLFLNSYFNYTSGIAINDDGSNLGEKFYLSGPDPYYNMRLVEKTIETGHYPFMINDDPLLNYPLGRSGARPPLFNMITTGVSKILTPFMGKINAMGYSMQFLPALYGALLIIPVYLIGETLFGKRAGILAALFVALIPIHISSGHGSAYSLYDHDSFNLLLFVITFFFIIKSLREENLKKSIIYAALSGVSVAAISMTWAAAQFIYSIIVVYAVVQLVADLFTKKTVMPTMRTTFITLLTGCVISSPYWFQSKFSLNLPLMLLIVVVAFGAICMYLQHKKIPWILSLPTLFVIGGSAAGVLYLIRNATSGILGQFARLSHVLYGKILYGGKTSITVAEAGTFGLSRTVMSFGPVLYWLGWMGFILLLYRYYKKRRREYLFLATWFMIEIWLCTTAGRFLNDLVPFMAILGGWIAWLIIEKIDFSKMVNTVRGIGGGWYGIKKGVKARHIAGAAFIAFFIMIPNGWMAFDASVPVTEKRDFGLEGGAFGLGLHTEEYWTDALTWLSQQDNETDKPADRPGFISWWDYGFYCAAIGEHPTVADNFQVGIPTAANFHTAKDEKEGIAVWIVRLAEGNMKNNGKLSQEVIEVFDKYLEKNESENLTNILQEPARYAPSYNELVCPEYGNKEYRVREENAMYHDATDILTKLSDDEITWLYHDMQNVTGYSIRYYGVEGYDINIFNVFSFLADKGTFGYATDEDNYFKMWYVDEHGREYTPEEIENMSREEREEIGRLTPKVERKDAFFNTMVYKTYIGMPVSKEEFEQYFTSWQYSGYLPYLIRPAAELRHFVVEYISPITEDKPFYFARASLCRGCPAVVIAKYYEGAYINGTITSNGETMDVQVTVIDDKLGLPHDSVFTVNGNFSVIAPAGNISLRITTGSGENLVELESFTFNSTTDPERAPITDNDAMRRSGSNYSRWIDISIERGSVEGTVFWDKDGDGKYNESVDKPMRDVKVKLGEKEKKTNSKGYYSFHDLIPGTYTITATKKGYDDGTAKVSIEPNAAATQNISMVPSKVKVSGVVWYDADENGRRDENETVANVPINFVVINAPDENAVNTTATSNSTGHYEKSLSPATYKIEVNYIQENETYIYSDEIEIGIGDSDKTRNIKLEKVED